nr:hypothetical protein [Tanacetum cinerariifolium]
MDFKIREEQKNDSITYKLGWSISITFRFSVGLQTPDDLSRSRLGFIEKMDEMDTQETDKNQAKNDKTKHKLEKIYKTKSFEAKSQKSKPEVNKINPGKVKVNLKNVKVNPNKAEAEK